MKKLIFLTSFVILIANFVDAQKFTITDYRASGFDNADVNKKQREYLGMTVSLTFYDNSVRLGKFISSDGIEYAGMKFPILNKVDGSTYYYSDGNSKYTLKLEKVAAYIKGAKIYFEGKEKQKSISGSITLKRDH